MGYRGPARAAASGTWRRRIVLLAGLPIALASPALPSIAFAEGPTIEEIMVTAQKREENLRDVPIAITALTSSYLGDRAITSVGRLDALAPGLVVNPTPTQPNNAQIAIRGSVQQNGAIVLDPSVGMYLDGVYIGKSQGAMFDIDDLERVEVLRGPQGTLYGRNTLAGAINLITRRPGNQFRGSAEVSYGNFASVTAKAMVNLPVADRLFVKLSGSSMTRKGTVRLIGDPHSVAGMPLAALYNGSVTQDPYGAGAKAGRLGSRNHRSVLAQVRLQPMDGVTLDYSLDHSRARDSADSSQLQSVDPSGFLGANCAYGPAVCLPAHLYVQPDHSNTAFNDIRTRERLNITGHALTATLDRDDMTLKSVTGYRRMGYSGFPADLDGTPLWLATGGLITSYDAFSQELQTVGRIGKKLRYVGGLYYFQDDGNTNNPQNFFFGSVSYDTRYRGTTNAYAGYGQVDYEATDALTLTVGVRYTREKKTIERFQLLLPGTVLVNVTKSDDVSHWFHALNPTAVLAFKATDDVNLYAKFAQGYRSGGYNGESGTRIGTTIPFEAETIDSYEVGIKSRLFDRRIDLNVAGFFNHHKNMQLSVFTAAAALESLIQNAGSADMKGIEVEATLQVTEAIRLGANLAYLDASYRKFQDTDALGATVDVAANRVIPHAPRLQLSANANIRIYQGAAGDRLSLLLDGRYTGRYYLYPYAKVATSDFPLVSAAASVRTQRLALLDAQLRWQEIPVGAAAGWLAVWARNLTDTAKKVNGINFGPSFGALNIATYNEPRMFGVTLGLKF